MLYMFYMHFTLIVSVFMLSICDTEINQSINQSFDSIKEASSHIAIIYTTQTLIIINFNFGLQDMLVI